MWEHSELQKKIETPVLLAHVIEDSTDIFGISGEFEPPKPPLGTPLVWTAETLRIFQNLSTEMFFFLIETG